jgi:aldose 1-epimerase
VPDKAGKRSTSSAASRRSTSYQGQQPAFNGIASRRQLASGAQLPSKAKKAYKLANNNNGTPLHGGKKGYDRVVWDAERRIVEWTYQLTYLSKMVRGYPGNLRPRSHADQRQRVSR